MRASVTTRHGWKVRLLETCDKIKRATNDFDPNAPAFTLTILENLEREYAQILDEMREHVKAVAA